MKQKIKRLKPSQLTGHDGLHQDGLHQDGSDHHGNNSGFKQITPETSVVTIEHMIYYKSYRVQYVYKSRIEF
jgi:hypothetical protein